MAMRAAVARFTLHHRPLSYAAAAASASRISCYSPSNLSGGGGGVLLRCRSAIIHSDARTEPVPVAEPKDEDHTPQAETWKVKMLYDGDCPLCMREVNMLRERNKSYGSIKFVDISSKDYSPQDNQGLDYQTAMGRIHAILSDGTVVQDVEAFRRLYEAVGLGWVYAITKYEPIAKVANSVYSIWAKYRLQITGRPPLEDILEERKKNMGETCTDDKVCKM